MQCDLHRFARALRFSTKSGSRAGGGRGPAMTNGHVDLKRRELLRLAAFGGGSLALMRSNAGFAQTVPLRETADLITGPFYPQRKPADSDHDLTRVHGHQGRARGQGVRLSGRLVNVKGTPLANTRIEIWQANANGRYSHRSDPNVQLLPDPDFQGFAALTTDRDGRYTITTVKPGPYPTARGDMRAPHIHFEVHGETDRKTTQMFFPNEPLNQQDRHLSSVRRPETILATITSPATDSIWIANWDIVLKNG